MQQKLSNQAEKIELAMEAIVTRSRLEANYNNARLELHPHQLFLRNDALFLRAFNPNKSRRSDEEPSLGNYKLDGLKDLALVRETFDPLESFNGELSRSDDHSLADVTVA